MIMYRCSRIGPSIMNGKNCRAFTMTTVPITIRMKNGLATGKRC